MGIREVGGDAFRLLLKSLLFIAIAPGSVAVYAPLALRWGSKPAGMPWGIIAGALFALGAGLAGWCVWDFAVIGRGTPAPIDAPKRLVTRGPYAVARNPMYVGVLLALLGWLALYPMVALAIYASAVALGFHVSVVFYEEPHLRRVFGAEYGDYCSRVGRWFLRLR